MGCPRRMRGKKQSLLPGCCPGGGDVGCAAWTPTRKKETSPEEKGKPGYARPCRALSGLPRPQPDGCLAPLDSLTRGTAHAFPSVPGQRQERSRSPSLRPRVPNQGRLTPARLAPADPPGPSATLEAAKAGSWRHVNKPDTPTPP